MQGHGALWRETGDIYIGQFKASRYHGEGVMQFANGEKYEGQWCEGVPRGCVILLFFRLIIQLNTSLI